MISWLPRDRGLSAEQAKNTAIAGNVTGDKYREMLEIWRVRRGGRALTAGVVHGWFRDARDMSSHPRSPEQTDVMPAIRICSDRMTLLILRSD